jgi:hypothetical protein
LSFRQLKGVRPDLPYAKIRPEFSSALGLEIQIQVDYRASPAGLDLSTPIIASFLKDFATFFVKSDPSGNCRSLPSALVPQPSSGEDYEVFGLV